MGRQETLSAQGADQVRLIFRRSTLLLLLISGIAYAQSTLGVTQNSSPEIQAQTGAAGTQRKPCLGCEAVPKPVPDRIYYYLFLQHIGREDQEVQRALAEGKDISEIRWDYQNTVHLREDETKQMLSVALEGYRAIEAKEQEVQDGIRLLHEQYTNAQIAKMKTPENLKHLNDERWQLVGNTMANLRQALGQEEYQKLDSFIHATWGAHTSRFQQRDRAASDPSSLLAGPNATKVNDQEQ